MEINTALWVIGLWWLAHQQGEQHPQSIPQKTEIPDWGNSCPSLVPPGWKAQSSFARKVSCLKKCQRKCFLSREGSHNILQIKESLQYNGLQTHWNNQLKLKEDWNCKITWDFISNRKIFWSRKPFLYFCLYCIVSNLATFSVISSSVIYLF